MILTSTEELRLCLPAHAIDSIDPLVGFIDNSEHDFLEEKLGTPLYDALCKYYDNHHQEDSTVEDQNTGYFNRLLLMCQRIVAFDAIGRGIGVHAISVNNAGINIATADDYGKVDDKAIDRFVSTCTKEAHASLNRLLQSLERWTKELDSSSSSDDDSAETVETVIEDEKQKIVTLWRQSRYFYLAAGMLLPSAMVLQDYLNIYDSREKFIQMLPDIRYLQEEVIAPAIGEELLEWLVKPTEDSVQNRTEGVAGKTIVKLRKTLAAMLEERTQVLKTDKTRRQQAHDEAVRLLQSAIDYIAKHQSDFPEDIIQLSPIYTPSPPASSVDGDATAVCPPPKDGSGFENNKPGSALFLTPFLH